MTVVLSGVARLADTTGNAVELAAGGVAVMTSGRGAWQWTAAQPGGIARIFRIGIALTPAAESEHALSAHVQAKAVPKDGVTRVLLGKHVTTVGAFDAPTDINIFHVRLSKGERWEYVLPAGHMISWIAMNQGRLRARSAKSSEPVRRGEFAVFEKSAGQLHVQAEAETSFLFGSAGMHPYALLCNHLSVHTCNQAMRMAQGVIARIGRKLLAQGRIR